MHIYVLAETQVVTEFDRSFDIYSYTSHYIHTNRKYWYTNCCLLVLRLCSNSSDLNKLDGAGPVDNRPHSLTNSPTLTKI